ncbi:MAG: TolC family protein [Candidatus Delongbacteria bacterium]|jgi:outer membrane protein|nr:TolC family protein [Candidatus Delongbacteria bacterium]
MKKSWFITIVIIFFVNGVLFSQQETWSLERCIQYAIDNSISIKQQKLNTDYEKNNVLTTKMSVLPSINSSAYQSFTFGRSVDMYTNEFSEDNTSSLNMDISARMDLFNGFQKYHKIQKSKLNLDASLKDLEKAKNDISIAIANAFFNVLYNLELVETSHAQVSTTEEQVSNTEKLVDAGSLARGNLLEVKSQLANEELKLVNAENALDLAYLNLQQLLELDTVKNFSIMAPQIDALDETQLLPKAYQIYLEAKMNMPQMEAARLDVQIAREDIAIARSGHYPSLNLSASYGSGFSDARQEIDEIMPADPLPIGYAVSQEGGGEIFDVYQYNFDYTYNTKHFSDQIRDNASTSISLGLSIPIFNGWQINSSVSNAKISHQAAKYNLESTRKQLLKEIQQAHADAKAAMKKYIATKKALEAMQESFKHTEKKFSIGMVNSLEYNTAKTQLNNTESELLRAKYEFVFKQKILDFYRGIPITLSEK